jgi:hypothetical protein
MTTPDFKTIPIENLRFDLSNPRYQGMTGQRDVLQRIVAEQRAKVLRIGRDIAENGMNPLKRAMVERAKGGGYTVLEGNRRLAALKLLTQPDLRDSIGLTDAEVKQVKKLVNEAGESLPSELDCVVMTRESGEHWIFLEHTGQNEGAGTVPWDAGAVGRFKGGSPALQAVELVRPFLDADSVEDLLTEGTTTLQRLLGTEAVRDRLGVQVEKSRLTLDPKDNLALARLVAVAQDIVNRDISSRGLNSATQRKAYANAVSQRVVKPVGGGAGAGAGGSGRTIGGAKPTRRQPPERTKLIPRRCSIAISRPRINRIYAELQDLRLKDFLNAGAVLLRVFVELSSDEYAERNGISFLVTGKPGQQIPKGKEFELRKKLRLVADHLESSGRCTKAHLTGIRGIISSNDGPLAIDTWNAYIHNKQYSPSVRDLVRTWDNIEMFVIGLWKK